MERVAVHANEESNLARPHSRSPQKLTAAWRACAGTVGVSVWLAGLGHRLTNEKNTEEGMAKYVLLLLTNLVCFGFTLIGTCGLFVDGKYRRVERFADLPFQQETRILNRTLTCQQGTRGTFSTVTYTCDDVRVDGLRLAYGYYPGWGVGEKCQETGGRQELARLCKHLLDKLGKRHTGFYGLIVSNATCSYTEERRLMFIKKNKRRHKWVSMGPGHGWLTSLSCMLKPER